MNVAEQLNAKGATPETVLEVMKTSVFEVSGDLSVDQMRAVLRSAALDEDLIDQGLEELIEKPDLVREVALLWIAAGANADGIRDAVEGALADADRQMPVIEITAIALVALYAIYKLGNAKPTKDTCKIVYRPDGSWEQSKVRIYDNFSDPLKGLLGIFAAKKGDDGSV